MNDTKPKIQILEIVKDVMAKTKDQEFPDFKERVASLHNPIYDEIFANVQTTEHGDLVLFRYGRYSDVISGESENFGNDWVNFWNMHGGIYRELRSITIDINKLEVVLYPFNKFFNINELEETSLEEVEKRIKNAKSIEFSDKLDGSMVVGRYWNGRYILSGSKALDPNQSWRLKDSYEMLEKSEGIKHMMHDNPDMTFIFESLTKADAHVVKYNEEDYGLHLIGIRDMSDYSMMTYRTILGWASFYNVPTTKVFDKTLDEVMSSLDDKKSNEAEGFVLNVDGFYVKIKYDDYANMHNILSKLSSINLIIRAIADGTLDDLYSKTPMAYRGRIDSVVSVVTKYIREIEQRITDFYEKNKHLDVKDFCILTNTTADKDIRGFIISKYKGKPYNVLKRGSSGYKRLNEMGIQTSDYLRIFDSEE